jgi:hypothetical protein
MTKHTTRPGGDSPDQPVTLMLGAMAELIDKTRIEILGLLTDMKESMDIIARQVKRQIPEQE